MNPYENLVFVLSELAKNARYAAEAMAYEHAAELLREAIKSE
jgi:hypothetical protein